MRSLTVALVAAAAVLLPAAPAGAAPVVPDPGTTITAAPPSSPLIRDGWAASGGAAGPLGEPVGGVLQLLDGGVEQEFENGSVFWSPSTGSHAVHGTIWQVATWSSYGPGPLGYPTAGQVCGLRDGGCYQEFQQGSYYSVPSIGVSSVRSEDRALWSRHGRENGPLGYPAGEMLCGNEPGDSCLQHFEGGAIHRSLAYDSGAAVFGPIFQTWFFGQASVVIGRPTADQVCGRPGGGCTQAFEGGTVYWSAATRAQWSRGAILTAYRLAGAEAGKLGYPTTSEVCGLTRGGCLQLFRNGGIYWSPITGAHPVRGAIRTAWNNAWSQDGRLGYPTGSERCGLRGGGCFQEFQGGAIYWSPSTGGQIVLGAIRESWARQRWETGSLGYPTAGERCGLRGGGCFQEFQGGNIYWSPASGAHPVSGGLRAAWAIQGWERGRLGYPVSGPRLSGGAFRQTFQGGTIAISARGTSISYR